MRYYSSKKKQLSISNTFTNPVITLRRESLKIVLDSMIDESKCNRPIEPEDAALTRINGTIFTTEDLNSAYNQIPLDNESMRYTHFNIGNEHYCFKRFFLPNINRTSGLCLNINTFLISINTERNRNKLNR